MGDRAVGRAARGWIGLALSAWLCVGLSAEAIHAREKARGTAPATRIARGHAPPEPWQGVTAAEIAAVRYDDLPPDDSLYVPVAGSLDGLGPEAKARLAAIEDTLTYWPPGREGRLDQRVRDLLSVCAVADLAEDENEGEIALAVFGQIRDAVPAPALEKVLTWIILHPAEGRVRTDAAEFGVQPASAEPAVRERGAMYAKKLLWRLLQKDPVAAAAAARQPDEKR